MGVLQDRVRLAFDKYSAGDLEGFVKGLVDVADVRWGWHRGIVDAEVEQELRKLRMMRIGGTQEETPGRTGRDRNQQCGWGCRILRFLGRAFR